MRIRKGFRQQVRKVIGRRPRQNPIVVLRKALCLHQRLPPSVRATPEIRMLHILPVVSLDRRLRYARHFVDSPVSEVRYLFGMSQRPTRVSCISGVTPVRAAHGITLRNADSQLRVTNLSGESSVAPALQLPVPSAAIVAIRGHPHFDLDRGIRARRGFRHHPAERRNHFVERTISSPPWRNIWRRERSGGDRLRRKDSRSEQFQLRQILARMCSGGRVLPVSPARQQRRANHRENHLPHDEFPPAFQHVSRRSAR